MILVLKTIFPVFEYKTARLNLKPFLIKNKLWHENTLNFKPGFELFLVAWISSVCLGRAKMMLGRFFLKHIQRAFDQQYALFISCAKVSRREKQVGFPNKHCLK